MKITGTFIGINRYISPDINDLTCAARDGKALWALFSDTFKEINAQLLIDNEATCESIKKSISATLTSAGINDIAIISFSGHGSRNHKLVAHDTTKDDLETTSIPMEFLANQFKKSKAKVIICIIDCCFSGGAPAKVFDDTPVPRDLDDVYETLTGKGRILLAASNASQPAYEKLGIGHGLLTDAVIRVLKTSDESQVDVTTAIYQIINIVQAEAQRMGITQTPVVLSLIEGGLTLPSLREGNNYLALFPPERQIIVSPKLSDLSQFGLPNLVIEKWQRRFPDGLNPLQIKAVNEYKVLAGESLLVVAPTSSGKTFIGEIAAINAIAKGRKAVFLLPYRALVNEKYQEFNGIYTESAQMSVIRCTGDYSDQTSSFVRGKFDLAILTFEMFLNLVVTNPASLNQIGLIVLDEAQFITDPNRGISIELLLTAIISARTRGVSPQIIALSAVIGSVNNFDAWLDLKLLMTNERPVPLTEGVLDRSGTYQYLDTDGSIKKTQLLQSYEIKQRRDKPSSQDIIVPLAAQLIANGEKILIFRNMRGNAQGCANYLATDLGLPPAQVAIDKLPIYDQSATSQALRNCLNGGTAFHTSNLSRDEREVVESTFRDSAGPIKILAATTTVAAGINTPASTVIIAEQEFIGEDGRAFTVAEYKNMAGRAGRLGFSETGKSIILAESSIQKDQLFQKYVMGRVESMRSSFDPQNINTWVVRLLAQIKSIPRKDIIQLLINTYGGYLATIADPSWPQKMDNQVSTIVARMLSLGLLEEEGEQIQLTLLGRSCGNSSLTFESALRLVDLVRAFSSWELDSMTLTALVQILQESDDTYTPLSRRGAGEQIRIRQSTTRYGAQIVTALQKYAGDTYTFQARCKRASVLFDWIHGSTFEEIEREFSYTPYQGAIHAGDIRRFADNTRFHLRSAYQIAMIVAPQSLCSQEKFEALLQQLEVGLPHDGLELLRIPVPLNRGEYLALIKKNVKSINEFWMLSKEDFSSLLGNNRAVQLEAFRPTI
ncbi:TPA: DEAD/DEAH box helicase [Legionella pneumophila]|nr:DEAD/DEAH box helicase [Legionella pneumophila]